MSETAASTIQYRVTEAIIDDSVVVLSKTMFDASLDLVSSLPVVLSS